MRPAIIFALLFTVLQQNPAPQQPAVPPGSIEGLILHAVTGDPVTGARVTLSRVQAPSAPGQATPPPIPQSNPAVNTDAEGKFVFKDLEPGQYRVLVASNGFARTEYGQRVFGAPGTTLTLVSGQTVKDILVRLTPAGNVSGRIRDLGGQPAVGVNVQLMKASYSALGQRSYTSAGSARTNDRGEYRLYWVTPGRYYLNVGASQGPVNVGGGGASPNEVQDSFISTYYPNVTDVSLATPLDVRPGSEIGGIDVIVNRQQLYRIRGRVIDARSERPPQAVTLSISSRGLTGGGFTMYGGSGQRYNNNDGSFELRDMTPGSYVIGAQITETSGVMTSSAQAANQPRAQAAVTVVNADVESLVLTIASVMSVPGRLAIDGQALSAITALDRLRVQLSAPPDAISFAGPGNQAQPQAVTADGSFKIDNVVPGDYRVTVGGLPPGYYLKSAKFDQIEIVDQTLRLPPGSTATLDVLLSANAGQVEGTLVDDKQQVVRGIQTVLIPDRQRNRPDLYRTATSDQNGRFTFRGIPPGDYKIFAWEAIENFGYYDPDLLRAVEAKGKPVHVTESSNQTAEVRIIPAS